MISFRTAAFVVFRKELLDALRDRRTLFMVLVTSVAMGPLLLVALSGLMSGIEARAERREMLVSGIEHAPTLVNFLRRQTLLPQEAPADFEQQIADGKLLDAVLVLKPSFEDELARGEQPLVEIVYSSAQTRAGPAVGQLQRSMQAFASEQATLRLAMRGVSPAVLKVADVQQRDTASAQTRGAQITGMLPYFVLMAVLYGALAAALDTTAGERERGSLEPLLTNPAPHLALVVGKWGAVASVGLLIALLGCFSFLPGQWLLRSERLAAMFRYGPWEALQFMVLLAPLAAALSALLMAVAIRCRTFKEAQTNNTFVVLSVSLLPMVTLFVDGESPWYLWVPALGQVTLMGRVLKGDAIGVGDVAIAAAVAAVLAFASLWFIARVLRNAAVR